MVKFKILDTVALLRAIPEKNLDKGQVGTIVEILDEKNFEIEFCNAKGETITVTPLHEDTLILLHFDPLPA